MNSNIHNIAVPHMETHREKGKRLSWEVGRVMLIGVGGNLLLFLFLTTFLHIFSAVAFIPWIVAFNGLVSGYSLVDRARDSIRRWKLFSAITGGGIASISCAVLVMLSYFHLGENLLPMYDVAFFILVGVIGSELGTLLGVKYFKL
jgi:hypothetical protein